MGIPVNIETLLSGGVIEHARIEFKETWDPAASLKTICAFANDLDNWGGGYIVVGVREEDDGSRTLVGVPADKVDGYLKNMLNKCKLIRPDYMPIVDVARYEGRHFIVVWAPGGSVRPYSSPKSMAKDAGRAYYIRKMASTIEPSAEELRELYSLANNVPFDDRPNHSARVEDFSIDLIKGFLYEVNSSLYAEADAMSLVELCRRMDIVAGPDEFVEPKNVGLMFFSPDPARFFPCARIDVVEFPDGLGGARVIENSFTGPLHEQLRAALRYLRNSVVKELIVKRDDRAEADHCSSYPFAAIEEALSNAVYHKGYDVPEPIEVRVLPDRIEVLSFPGADRSVSIEGLRTFRAITRRYRNRRVGDFLKELRLTEGRNTGMAKILHAMRVNGSPDPVFETDGERLSFLTTLPIHPAFRADDEGLAGVASSHPAARVTGVSDTPTVPTPTSTSVSTSTSASSRPEDVLLDYLSEHPEATAAQTAYDLGVSPATISRRISILKAAGRLSREGSSRSGKWVVMGRGETGGGETGGGVR